MSDVGFGAIKQRGGKDCTATCIEMIIAYYGIDMSRDEIEAHIRKNSTGHIHMTDVACFFVGIGCDARCYAYNIFFSDPAWEGDAKDVCLQRLDEQVALINDDWYRPRLLSTIECIKQGVEYHIVRPSYELIRGLIANGFVLVCAVSYYVLVGEKGDPYQSHDIVVVDITDNEVTYADPCDGRIHTTSLSVVFAAMAARKFTVTSGYLAAVRH